MSSTKQLHSHDYVWKIRRIPVDFTGWCHNGRTITSQKIASSSLVIGAVARSIPRIPEYIFTAVKVWQKLCQVSVLNIALSWVTPICNRNLRDRSQSFTTCVQLLKKSSIHVDRPFSSQQSAPPDSCPDATDGETRVKGGDIAAASAWIFGHAAAASAGEAS